MRRRDVFYLAGIPQAPVELLFPAGSQFPACHASTLLPLPGGRILAAYFAGAREGQDDVGIWLSVKEAGVWQAPRQLAKVGPVPHWNPVLYLCREGIMLCFKAGTAIPYWQSYFMLSQDGGATWSAPAPAFPRKAAGPVRNKPLAASHGLVLAPASDETRTAWQPRVDISRDGGMTFPETAPIPLNRADTAREDHLVGLGAIQPALWEGDDGQLHAFLRTTGGRIFRSDSADGGKTWCTAYPTAIPNNNSGIDLVRAGDALYLAMNPVPGNWAARTPLLLCRSLDNGETFTPFRVLACGPGEFSYPAVVYNEGALYISFTWKRLSIGFCRVEV